MRKRETVHQILADGEVIYSGPNWTSAFLEAAFHPKYQRIVHVENGKVGACWGPVLCGPLEENEETSPQRCERSSKIF